MQEHLTRKTGPAEMMNGGAAVVVSTAVDTPRPSATNRIARPPAARTVWLNALIATSEQQRAHLRAQLAQSGVRS